MVLRLAQNKTGKIRHVISKKTGLISKTDTANVNKENMQNIKNNV